MKSGDSSTVNIEFGLTRRDFGFGNVKIGGKVK